MNIEQDYILVRPTDPSPGRLRRAQLWVSRSSWEWFVLPKAPLEPQAVTHGMDVVKASGTAKDRGEALRAAERASDVLAATKGYLRTPGRPRTRIRATRMAARGQRFPEEQD